ncbi:MAG: hypothetical protein K5746_11505 [Clostridiales bacterium]|nr:hypothetical protein [Clostridiales bacterium]
MSRQSMDGSKLLSAYDRATGIFNEIFDARLLTPALGALLFYCCLFTQRKFPMRWMLFVLFGMVLLVFATLTARVPGKARTRFRLSMAGLWFALHGMMVISGFFHEDWLPESVPLLICYPVMFSVFSSRDDDDTFRCILKGALVGTLPFLLWTWIAFPLTYGYPGYRGVFYDANTLAMCCIVTATAAFLLAYACLREGKKGAAVFCLLAGAGASATLLCTMSRSGLLAFLGVAFILGGSIAAGTAKRPGAVVAALLALAVVAGVFGWRVTKDKMMKSFEEDYELALYNHETFGSPMMWAKPEDRVITMDDLTSDRWGIWKTILENPSWNGHDSSVVEEWVQKDGGDRRFNAHSAFLGVFYNNGWIAGILLVCYTLLSFIRSLTYYWRRRKESALAATPLAFCTVFILVGLFESVYAPFSLIGCAYLLVQAPLWRAEEEA